MLYMYKILLSYSKIVWSYLSGILWYRSNSLVAQMVKNSPAMWETWVHPWVGKISWRRAWHPTPVFLSRESLGERGLASYSLWGHKELDTTEWLSACECVCVCVHMHTHTALRGNSFQFWRKQAFAPFGTSSAFDISVTDSFQFLAA